MGKLAVPKAAWCVIPLGLSFAYLSAALVVFYLGSDQRRQYDVIDVRGYMRTDLGHTPNIQNAPADSGYVERHPAPSFFENGGMQIATDYAFDPAPLYTRIQKVGQGARWESKPGYHLVGLCFMLAAMVSFGCALVAKRLIVQSDAATTAKKETLAISVKEGEVTVGRLVVEFALTAALYALACSFIITLAFMGFYGAYAFTFVERLSTGDQWTRPVGKLASDFTRCMLKPGFADYVPGVGVRYPADLWNSRKIWDGSTPAVELTGSCQGMFWYYTSEWPIFHLVPHYYRVLPSPSDYVYRFFFILFQWAKLGAAPPLLYACLFAICPVTRTIVVPCFSILWYGYMTVRFGIHEEGGADSATRAHSRTPCSPPPHPYAFAPGAGDPPRGVCARNG